jgi:hypothetical protein
MFARLLDAIHADVEQQLAWARTEYRRQAGHVVLTIILTAVASLAGLGAVAVGLIALYTLARDATRSVHRARRNWWRPFATCAYPVRVSSDSTAPPIRLTATAAIGSASRPTWNFDVGS